MGKRTRVQKRQLSRKFCQLQMQEAVLPRVIAHEVFSVWEEAIRSSKRTSKAGYPNGQDVCVARVRRISGRGLHLLQPR